MIWKGAAVDPGVIRLRTMNSMTTVQVRTAGQPLLGEMDVQLKRLPEASGDDGPYASREWLFAMAVVY